MQNWPVYDDTKGRRWKVEDEENDKIISFFLYTSSLINGSLLKYLIFLRMDI